MVTTPARLAGQHATDVDPRRERFRRLAAQRTNVVLEKIRILGNCANSYQYSYNDEEISRMFSSIDSELRRVRSLFSPQKREKFSF